jgi:hypothetical protein
MTAAARPVSDVHLVQVNVARLQAPLDSAQLKDFVDLLGPINALADSAPGFVWRLQDASGNATEIRFGSDPMLIVNLTVWESVEALWQFAYHSRHMDLLRRRREWFERHAESYLALWWVPAGTIPTTDDAHERLSSLRANGPTPFAFTFRAQFTAEGSPVASPPASDQMLG